MMKQIAVFTVVCLFLAGCTRPAPNHRYTFEHRADGIWRYDHQEGEISIMRPGQVGWQKVVTPASN